MKTDNEIAKWLAGLIAERIGDTILESVQEEISVDDIADQIADGVQLTDIAACIDTQDVAGHIDVDDVAEAINLDSVAGHIDTDAVAGAIDIEDVAASINLDAVAEKLDHPRIAAAVERLEVADHAATLADIVGNVVTELVDEIEDLERRLVLVAHEVAHTNVSRAHQAEEIEHMKRRLTELELATVHRPWWKRFLGIA